MRPRGGDRAIATRYGRHGDRGLDDRWLPDRAYGIDGGGPPPFDPSQVAGLSGWWASDSLTLADGAAVSLWPDKSGNGHNLTVGSLGATKAATAPTFHTAGPNGKPKVTFDGVNNSLTTGLFSTIINQPDTIIGVYDTGRVTEQEGAGTRQAVGDVFDASFTAFAGGFGFSGGTGHNQVAGFFHVNTVIFSGVTSRIYLDGTLIGGPADAGSQAMDGFDMMSYAGSVQVAGSVCELLIYATALTNADKNSVESYLKTKYGL